MSEATTERSRAEVVPFSVTTERAESREASTTT